MIGHVFQVFLTDAEVDAALRTMHTHLTSTGTTTFESRNPRRDRRREWNVERELSTTAGPVTKALRTKWRRGDRPSFTQAYTFHDEVITSTSTLRFLNEDEIHDRVERAGLNVVRLAGGWHGEPFDPETSREMVVTVRRRI